MQDKNDLATEYLVAVSVPRAVCGVGSVIYSAGGGSRPRGGGGPAPGSGALQQPRPRPRPRPGHVVVAAARAPRHRVGHLHRGGVMWGSAGWGVGSPWPGSAWRSGWWRARGWRRSSARRGWRGCGLHPGPHLPRCRELNIMIVRTQSPAARTATRVR